jgi:replicative DNA helicase
MPENYNLNIEKAMLSTVLFEVGSFGEMLDAGLEAKHFYLPFHSYFWDVCVQLEADEMPIDEEFIVKRLKKAGHFEESHFLEVLCTTQLGNYGAYVEELKSLYMARTLQALIKQAGNTQEIDVDALQAQISIVSEAKTRKTSPKRLVDVEAKEVEFMGKEWLPFPVDTVSMISAAGGTGKTWTILQVAIRYCLDNPTKKAYLWLSEDLESLVKSRAIAAAKLISYDTFLPKNLYISNDSPLTLLDRNKLSPDFMTLKRELKDYDLIVFDPLLAFFGGDENDNSQARMFMQPFLNWALKDKKTIIFLHHSNKSEGKARGAGAFIDAVRCAYELSFIMDKTKQQIDSTRRHERNLHLAKDNYGAALILQATRVVRTVTPKYIAPVECKETTFQEREGDIRGLI